MHLKSVRWSVIVDEGGYEVCSHLCAYSVVPCAERCEALVKEGNAHD